MSDKVSIVTEWLGTEATREDAQLVLALAESIAAEQGDDSENVIEWLRNRTYDLTRLYDAALGDAAAIAYVRAEAGLPVVR